MMLILLKDDVWINPDQVVSISKYEEYVDTNHNRDVVLLVMSSGEEYEFRNKTLDQIRNRVLGRPDNFGNVFDQQTNKRNDED
jgi:hypothetical protein